MTINVDLWKTLIDLKKCKWVDLTHAFGSDTPKWSGFKAEKIETLFTIEKDGIFVNQYTFPGQYGTHMDAPGHFAAGKRLIEDIELKEMVLPLVVIDCSEKFKENPDYELTLEDLLAFEAEYGIIPEGSFVAMRTDWGKNWPDQEKCSNADSEGNLHYPGWAYETLEFLYETRKIAASGHEPFDTDAPIRQAEYGFKGENYILNQDKYQIEVMTNLDKVPPVGSIIFCVVPKAKNAPGFPVRAFAIVNE
ncbi:MULTISPECIES: cyclase family protein [Clostridium]|uniref:Kynurenine formamidase n=3 Tax=Clostridium TaxID=1485 RepID=D8GPN0_CLOLD|nr:MULTISPECIES: cyclase family protein [Clostridium]ADK13939.1 putative cyclase [Clostridium ljungdahlii DSM 13528]AGY77170.1 cyclase family protein [Clostridium autoethanogenum DSM 10061]ALU37311.1 Cyclase [Clostridium autoethanogenum DSM 10061]OAA87430.1 Kynurenine formamidase [Clostridium ljungdahlii DSM 13528]OBR95714.1 kynurenine formamidase [Clostridium ragsdalei P11]